VINTPPALGPSSVWPFRIVEWGGDKVPVRIRRAKNPAFPTNCIPLPKFGHNTISYTPSLPNAGLRIVLEKV